MISSKETPVHGRISLQILAQATGAARESEQLLHSGHGIVVMWWAFSLLCSVVALVFALWFYRWMLRQDEGDADMVRIAGYVRSAAMVYLRQQYKVIACFFVVTSLALSVVAFGFRALSGWVPFALLSGGFFSALAGWFGMATATMASSRTAQAVKESLNSGLQVALRSGAVMGLSVVGLGLINISVWFAVLHWGAGMGLPELSVTLLCFGMGASGQALFARVGGGIFTKGADVGADLVGKVEAGIPEDDPRNPATIADNVGDNVGDVAGMGADLYESYSGSIVACAALGVAAFSGIPQMQAMSVVLPMALAGCGILLSVIGVFSVRIAGGQSQKHLMQALSRGISLSSAGVMVVAALLVWLMLVQPSLDVQTTLQERLLPAGDSLFGVFAAGRNSPASAGAGGNCGNSARWPGVRRPPAGKHGL